MLELPYHIISLSSLSLRESRFRDDVKYAIPRNWKV